MGNDNVKICSSCGKAMASDAVFCTGCGSRLAESTVKKCSSCGKSMPANAVFCTSCGNRLTESTGGIKDSRKSTSIPKILIPVLVVLLAATIGILGYFYFSGRITPASSQKELKSTDRKNVDKIESSDRKVFKKQGTVAGGKPFIETDKATYTYGEKIKVYYYNAPGYSRDWICIVKAGAKHTEPGNYQYLPHQGRGVLTFKSPRPGKYEARAYYNYSSSEYRISARYEFTVTNSSQSYQKNVSSFSPINKEDSSSNTGIIIGTLAGIIAAGIGIFFALYALGFFQYMGGKKSNPNAVSKETLYHNIMALNNPSKPYHIIPGDSENTDLIAEWKIADATWYGIFNKSGLRKIYKALLMLDEARHTVRCFEVLGTVEWMAGTAGLTPVAHYSKSRFGGRILFQKSYGVGYGIKDGTSMDIGKVYEYKFDVDEIKEPLEKIIKELGWEWVPVTAKRHVSYIAKPVYR